MVSSTWFTMNCICYVIDPPPCVILSYHMVFILCDLSLSTGIVYDLRSRDLTLYYVMLCDTRCYFTILYGAMLCYVALCYAILHYACVLLNRNTNISTCLVFPFVYLVCHVDTVPQDVVQPGRPSDCKRSAYIGERLWQMSRVGRICVSAPWALCVLGSSSRGSV